MSKDTSFAVGDHFTDFIKAQVSQGRYRNASDVVVAGLRLLEEHEAKLAVLRAELVTGEESGVSERNLEDIWADVRDRRARIGG